MTWQRTWCALCDAVAGNPLALLELPGVLDADQRAGRRPLDDPLSVTASVERAFLTRIDRLDADGREALESKRTGPVGVEVEPNLSPTVGSSRAPAPSRSYRTSSGRRVP